MALPRGPQAAPAPVARHPQPSLELRPPARPSFARRFTALGAAEGAVAGLLWCLAALAEPPERRAASLAGAAATGAAYGLLLCALRLWAASRLRDPASVRETALLTSLLALVPPAAVGAAHAGAPGALFVLGTATAVALLALRLAPSLPPAEQHAGRGIRLDLLFGGSVAALAIASWATIAAVVLAGAAAFGRRAGTALAGGMAVYGGAFLLYAFWVASATARALRGDLERIRNAIVTMTERGTFAHPLRVVPADETGRLAAALTELRARFAGDLDGYDRAFERARRAEAQRGEFLDVLARELREPLSAITHEAAGLREGRHGTLSAAQAEDVRAIEAASGHLLDLLGDLVDLSVLQSGALELARSEVDAATLLFDLARELRGLVMASNRPLELRVEAARPLFLHADPQRLRQILTNLVANAIKFTKEGGVTLRARRRGEAVEIAVSDTGSGIDPGELPHIFDEYQQGGPALAARAGHGLGLFIARRLAELHGGQLVAESTLGVGSTFTLTLPVDPPPAALSEGP